LENKDLLGFVAVAITAGRGVFVVRCGMVGCFCCAFDDRLLDRLLKMKTRFPPYKN
jgi:hypothetical protein